MGDLLEYLAKISDGLTDLTQDIGRIVEQKKSGKKASKKSLQPTTRLRKDKDALKKAQDDPDTTFILDKLNDIFEG